MVELTVDDLLRWKPAQMTLVGAVDEQRPAVEAEFSWAVCIRSTTPVLPPLRGGELIVVPQAVLEELDRLESVRWQEVARHLQALPIAGVISDHPGFIAGVENLLVIEVAPTGGTDLEVSLNREFTERRGSLYQLGSELARIFSSASIGGSELDGFLRLASQRTGIPLALIASTGRVLAESDESLNAPASLAGEELAGRRVELQGADWIGQPVSGVGLPDGVSLVAALPASEPGDRARLVLEQTGEALGLMFDRLPPIDTISPGREAGEILTELATNGVLPPAARRRLTQIASGLELDSELRLVVDLDLHTNLPNSLSFAVDGMQLHVADSAAYRELTAGSSQRYIVSPPFAGIERLPGVVASVSKAYRLQQAGYMDGWLDLGHPGSGGALGFLLAVAIADGEERKQPAAYARALLAELVAYDQSRGMELVNTLGVFLDAGASVAVAAKRLEVHRNTLAYRIARIEDVSGHDLSDPITRFDLQLAIALHRLENA